VRIHDHYGGSSVPRNLFAGPGARASHWYDGIVSAYHGAMNWIGDLTGFDNGHFSLGNVGLSGSNAAAASAVGDEIVVTARRVTDPIVHFYSGWEARGRTNNAVPEAGYYPAANAGIQSMPPARAVLREMAAQ
jgi:hypothetical protein